MNTICHYTTAESAIKILDSKTLWASGYERLDDSSELRMLIDHMGKIAKYSEYTLLNKFIGFMDGALQENNFYICSFSEQSSNHPSNKYENLTIARYFGGPEWVGIAFGSLAIENYISSEMKNKNHPIALLYNKVGYVDPDYFSTFPQSIEGMADLYWHVLSKKVYKKKSKLNKYLKAGFKISGHDKEENFKRLLIGIFQSDIKIVNNDDFTFSLVYLMLLKPLIKHIVFNAESEYRIVVSMPKSVEVPQDCIIQRIDNCQNNYLKLPFDYRHIAKIIIGPGKEQENIAIKIKEVLNKNKDTSGLSEKIILSEIPWNPYNKDST